MADRPVVLTTPLSRDEIARITGSPRGIKFIEALGQDVGTTLPDAAAANAAAVSSAQAAAIAAQASADAAAASVTALSLLIGQMGLDSTPALLGSIQAQIHALSKRISELEEAPPK